MHVHVHVHVVRACMCARVSVWKNMCNGRYKLQLHIRNRITGPRLASKQLHNCLASKRSRDGSLSRIKAVQRRITVSHQSSSTNKAVAGGMQKGGAFEVVSPYVSMRETREGAAAEDSGIWRLPVNASGFLFVRIHLIASLGYTNGKR